MKRSKEKIYLWQLFGFAVTSLLGTLLHFLYDWTGKNRISALISGVNESTFEHMKLILFPMLIFAFIEWSAFKDRRDLMQIKLCGMLIGVLLIPILFYTYNGAFGKSPDAVNIGIFFVSAAVAYFYEAKRLKAPDRPLINNSIASLLMLCLAVAFMLLTFFPPHIPLFKDPISGAYGIE